MGDTALTWAMLYVVWTLGCVLIAHAKRYAGERLGFSGWLGVAIMALCLLAFFIVAAQEFGRVVWILPMLGIWIGMAWLIASRRLP